MKGNKTTKQLLNAELAARSYNTRAKKVIKAQSPKKEQEGLVVNFYCECSDINCKESIPLTLDEYERLHSNEARFVLATGHAEPKVEEKIASTPEITVVEKIRPLEKRVILIRPNVIDICN